MGIDLSKMNVNLTAEAIFQKLDTSNGTQNDQKIEASIWNKFAEVTGGNTIENFIERDNAIKSIKSYLEKGGEAVKQKIVEFFGLNTQEEAQNTVNTATDILKDCAENPVTLKFEEHKLRDGNIEKVATLPDGRRIAAEFENGEITIIRVSTETNNALDYRGTYRDGYEVGFDKYGLSYWLETGSNYDNIKHGSSDKMHASAIGESYNFDELKALAEKIFNYNPSDVVKN